MIPTKQTKKLAQLKLDLRHVEAKAPPPTVFQVAKIDSSSSSCRGVPSIAYDVYEPNAGFSQSCPGLPDVHAAATFYNHNDSAFSDLQQLMTQADGIPLRIATVSDSGTVIMFGVTDLGVPVISRPSTTTNSENP